MRSCDQDLPWEEEYFSGELWLLSSKGSNACTYLLRAITKRRHGDHLFIARAGSNRRKVAETIHGVDRSQKLVEKN